LHAMVSTGSRLAIVPHKDKILQCLSLAQPDIIFSVPVLFNKVFDGVMKVNAKAPALQQRIFSAALSVARTRNHKLEFGEKVGPLLALQHRLADKLVLSKVRAKLGGKLK
jgi:long-chain acyl-CoA synthetase